MPAAKTPPWKRKRPAGKKPVRLSAQQKARARARAKAHARRYPNLTDNMWAAEQVKPKRKKR